MHLATCANCQAELALLHAFAAPAVRDDEAEVGGGASISCDVARRSSSIGAGRRTRRFEDGWPRACVTGRCWQLSCWPLLPVTT
jgi:hypothetical protein